MFAEPRISKYMLKGRQHTFSILIPALFIHHCDQWFFIVLIIKTSKFYKIFFSSHLSPAAGTLINSTRLSAFYLSAIHLYLQFCSSTSKFIHLPPNSIFPSQHPLLSNFKISPSLHSPLASKSTPSNLPLSKCHNSNKKKQFWMISSPRLLFKSLYFFWDHI